MNNICSIEDCGTYEFCRMLCEKHYFRWRKYGSPYVVSYIKNNQVKHPLYSTYRGMHARCESSAHKNYEYYGARGIKVCERWSGPYGFSHFLDDMGERPNGYTLDRIDNNKGYSPDNCRWAKRSTQQHNQRMHRDNTSGYKGVSLFKATGRWSAYIAVNGKRRHLGYFKTPEQAAKARKNAEIDYGIGN